MTMSLDAAAQVMRQAMREKVKRHSLCGISYKVLL
jgi:hypothetical protein